MSVEIDRYRPIFVMGEVGAAGQYSYVPGMTVQKAIAVAGGFSPRANQGNVDITRDINGKVHDRPRASPPTRCCPATRSTSANACSELLSSNRSALVAVEAATQTADRPLLPLARSAGSSGMCAT